jgi:integrase
MAAIEKRTSSNGELSYRVKIRKRGISTTRTFVRKADAQKWATDTEAAILAGTYQTTGSNGLTLAQAIDRYTAEVLPKLSADEQRVRAPRLQLWRDAFAARPLNELTAADIARVRDRWAAENLAAATVNRRLAALAAVYTAAAKQWHILPLAAHPVRAVARLPENNERVRFLSEAERAALLEATAASDNPFLHVAVVLSLATGWRQSEIMGLTWDRVDVQRGWLTLETSKNGERRGAPVSGYVLELLRAFGKVRRMDTALLFPSKVDAAKPMNLRKPWERALAAAGIEGFRWHDLRHTTASYLAMNGASLPEIGAVLGHKTPRMTQRYAHLSDEHISNVLGDMTSKVLG